MNKHIKKYNNINNSYDREKFYSIMENKFEKLDNQLFELSMIQAPTNKDKKDIKKIENEIDEINQFFLII